MIGKLTGEVSDLGPGWIILDVNGVGYLVNIAEGSFLEGDKVSLDIYTSVRETDISLWGFASKQEMNLFKMLLGVSGVGLKTANSIVASHGVAKVVNAILSDDAASLKVSGVGLKTAEKIIIDLRNKIEDLGVVEDSSGGIVVSKISDEHEEVVDALVSLGYKEYEVRQSIAKIPVELIEEVSTENLIKEILKRI